MNTHTPGPWRYIARDPECRIPFGIEFVSGRSSVLPIADICDNPIPEEREANAQLIAAAPELLEAMKDMLQVVAHTRHMLADHAPPSSLIAFDFGMSQAESVISKATGQSL